MKKADTYQKVTDQIIALLEAGTVPWRQSWKPGALRFAMNWNTGRPYRGINMMLPAGEYATFNQIKKAGGNVKKGEKGWSVVFWKLNEREDEENGQTKKIPILKHYTVFEINRQCTGLESRIPAAGEGQEEERPNPIEAGELVVKGYVGGPDISFASGRAVYRPFMDEVSVPPLQDYTQPEEYYCTLFHELVHSTGHQKRLNRPELQGVAAFGDESYSKEELTAEIGAAMLCGICGIENATIENSAAYIDNWLKQLRDDPTLIVQAAGKAQKAADYILGTTFEEEAAA